MTSMSANMSASMSVSVDPTVYLKHSSLSTSRHDTSVGFKLCSAANHITTGQILGSQQIRGLWKINLKLENTIPKLLQGDFLYNNVRVRRIVRLICQLFVSYAILEMADI